MNRVLPDGRVRSVRRGPKLADAGRKWEAADDALLQRLVREKSVPEIAEAMGRSVSGVSARLFRLRKQEESTQQARSNDTGHCGLRRLEYVQTATMSAEVASAPVRVNPGSAEKLLAMIRRRELGLPIFHPNDGVLDGGGECLSG